MRKRLSALAVAALASSGGCGFGHVDVTGDYALVEVRRPSANHYVRAGEHGVFGLIRLEPGGKLSGEAAIFGNRGRWLGTWIAKEHRITF
jgi:hypothetical protein